MNSWVKDSVPAELSPAAVVVALERDLLLSSMSRPAGSAAPIAPSAVPEKAGPGARAAAEVVALVRRGEYLAALGCPQARALLLGPSAEAGAAPASADASDAAAAADFYASIASNVAAASAAASARGGVEPAAHELLVLAVGVAALNAFHQVNVTGPDLPNAPACPAAPPSTPAAAAEWNRHALARLAVDGEDLVGKCRLPQYLLLASALLVDRSARRTEALVAADVTAATLADARAAAARAARRAAGAGAGRVRLWAEPLEASVETSVETTVTPPSCAWWSARAVLAHQRLLSGRSPTLRRRALGAAAAALASFAPENQPARAFGDARAGCLADASDTSAASGEAPTHRLLASMCLLEAALMEHEYGHVASADALLARARGALGVELELVGKMGFRTVHQTDAKAQMVLEASCAGLPVVSRSGGESDGSDESLGAASEDEADELEAAGGELEASASARSSAPASAAMARIAVELQGLSADGSQILTAPRLVADGEEANAGDGARNTARGVSSSSPSLPAAAQALILASAVTVRKSQADDGARSWSVAPYHELVGAQTRSRPILRAAAAVLASRHERERARTRERALLVLEDLVRGLDAHAPGAGARARFAHSTWFPPSSKLRRELGDCLIALGMVGPALELFEEIELWDALVVCLGLLGKKQAAADVVRRRLAEDPRDAKLWCALGDALDDESAYEKALEVSGGRSARASRSLARRAAAREDWPAAAARWSDAMRVNPLFPEGWFSCGYALLKARREDEALSAFVRCTQADCENGQAWNNVAALNIRRGRFDAAHVALREATKQLRNNWQTWENLAMVSAKVGHFQQSARALVKTMELTDGAQMHLATLSTLVERCLEARRGVAAWLGVEDRRDAETAREEARRAAALGNVAEVDDDDDEEEEETWDGVGGEAGGDAGDAAADMLDAFFSDSEEDDDGPSLGPEPVSAETPNPADPADPADLADTVATQVLAREVVRLEASVEEVFKRALSGGSAGARPVTETADVWRLAAEFREARGERVVAAEARLKRVRALDGSGWRKDKAAFVDYADASLEMCRGSLRNAALGFDANDAETLSAEEARRGVAQARMHLRGVLKVFEAQEWGEEMPGVLEELEKCAAEVDKAEQESASS